MAYNLDATARFIARFEGFRPWIYDDLNPNVPYKGGAVRGTLTIGYGETRRDLLDRYKNGITEPQALELLKQRIPAYRDDMLRLVSAPLTPDMEGALTSLVYNIGPGNDQRRTGFKYSPVREALNRGDYAGAAKSFAHHNRAGGKVLRGLTNRREAEAAWFLAGGLPGTIRGLVDNPGVPTWAEVEAELAKHDGYVEEPGNRTIFNRWYFGRNEPAPWCATYVSYCFAQAGLPLPATTEKGFAYTPSGAAWFQGRDKWSKKPSVGSVVFFHWPSMGRIAHVGVVAKVNADGSFYSWEGNTDVRGGRTGGRVILQHRSGASIGKLGGFGLVEYGQPVVSVRKEVDMFIGSVNGHAVLFEGGGVAVHIDSGEDIAKLKAAGIPEVPGDLNPDFAESHLIIWNKDAAGRYWAGEEVVRA